MTPKKPKPESERERFERAMSAILAAPKGKAGRPKAKPPKEAEGLIRIESQP